MGLMMSRNGQLRFIVYVVCETDLVGEIADARWRMVRARMKGHFTLRSNTVRSFDRSRFTRYRSNGSRSRAESKGEIRFTKKKLSDHRAPPCWVVVVCPEQRVHCREKSVESFTTSRHLNIIRQFCKRGLMAAVVFDMVCTSRQTGWYEVGSCYSVSREIAWDGLLYWHYGIGTLAGDHSPPQRIPMAPCADYGGLCVAGVA